MMSNMTLYPAHSDAQDANAANTYLHSEQISKFITSDEAYHFTFADPHDHLVYPLFSALFESTKLPRQRRGARAEDRPSSEEAP